MLSALKTQLNLDTDANDAELSALLSDAQETIGNHYDLPTVPQVEETRIVFADGSVLHLAECVSVTAVTDLDDSPLLYVTDPGRRPGDHLNGIILHDHYTGRVKVTGTWGYAGMPGDVAQAIVQTAAVWYRRQQYGNEGNFIGRLDAIPKQATDLLQARRHG